MKGRSKQGRAQPFSGHDLSLLPCLSKETGLLVGLYKVQNEGLAKPKDHVPLIHVPLTSGHLGSPRHTDPECVLGLCSG